MNSQINTCTSQLVWICMAYAQLYVLVHPQLIYFLLTLLYPTDNTRYSTCQGQQDFAMQMIQTETQEILLQQPVYMEPGRILNLFDNLKSIQLLFRWKQWKGRELYHYERNSYEWGTLFTDFGKFLFGNWCLKGTGSITHLFPLAGGNVSLKPLNISKISLKYWLCWEKFLLLT